MMRHFRFKTRMFAVAVLVFFGSMYGFGWQTRPPVQGTDHVVGAGTPLIASITSGILRDGGNAIDAGVAAGFASAVVEPTAHYSLASEVQILVYHAATGQVHYISGNARAPAAATVERYEELGFDLIPARTGPDAHFASGVPGSVAAFILALDEFGTMSLAEVMAPAIELAEQGFPMYAMMSERLAASSSIAMRTEWYPDAKEYYMPHGKTPQEGEIFRQPVLANTLRQLVSAEERALARGLDRSAALAAAHDAFYKGDIARLIDNYYQNVLDPPGLLTYADLAAMEVKLEEPWTITYTASDGQEYQVFSGHTDTHGPILLQALNILENFDLQTLGHNTPEYLHLMVEALKLGMADSRVHYGDPDFVEVPRDGLLSKAYALERSQLIDMTEAYPDMPPGGDPWAHQGGIGRTPSFSPAPFVATPQAPYDPDDLEGTTHYSIADRDGNLFSATPSGGVFSKAVVVPGLGASIGHRIESFSMDPENPNVLEPGKRPRSTLVQYIALRDGKPFMAWGTPGGDHQFQANLQIFLNLVEFGMTVQEAVEAPRVATLSAPGAFYPQTYTPGLAQLEAAFDDETAQALEAKGHFLNRGFVGVGSVLVTIDPDTGVLSVGAGPRRPTYGVGR